MADAQEMVDMSILNRNGPYIMGGYRAWVVQYSNGRRRTEYEHRLVVEKHLGRKLTKHELVHHRDGDRLNNSVPNLSVTGRVEHPSYHAHGEETVVLKCMLCGKEFVRMANDERHNRKVGKSGPFCGKGCAGRWSRYKQINGGQRNLRAGVLKVADKRASKVRG